MNQITINGTVYGIEGNNYDGDLLLLSPERDLNIEGGYNELRHDAAVEHGYVEYTTGDVECEEHAIQSYIDSHIIGYIMANYENALVTVN